MTNPPAKRSSTLPFAERPEGLAAFEALAPSRAQTPPPAREGGETAGLPFRRPRTRTGLP
jgi:hypothetical protein